jgi:hypothetical protein
MRPTSLKANLTTTSVQNTLASRTNFATLPPAKKNPSNRPYVCRRMGGFFADAIN